MIITRIFVSLEYLLQGVRKAIMFREDSGGGMIGNWMRICRIACGAVGAREEYTKSLETVWDEIIHNNMQNIYDNSNYMEARWIYCHI